MEQNDPIEEDHAVIIRVPTVVLNFGPTGMLGYARDFLHALSCWVPRGRGFSPVPYFLICRSIELSLKAFLMTKGMKQSELRKRPYGHDLVELLSKAKSHGLPDVAELAESDEGLIANANIFYSDKLYEYFKKPQNLLMSMNPAALPDPLPDIDALTLLSSRLIDAIDPVVATAST